ncbi:hypothetical protein H6P81_011117 [Aristolochia fimbriata]|uniref:Uncharacterized protein n=1 Tax=Aristolochia fimbriata TaxID=158543 RepID=A0AAV7EU36_ARIFI|nr:hypothetical protein H6P81_011117 [Aristolochia fimbriata]
MASAADQNVVKVVAQREVSPLPGSVTPSEVPLTYFDIALLSVPPIQQLFFFDFPCSTQDFLDAHFPLLELSLSRTLTLFFPAAGRLVPASDSHLGDHVIRYSDGDCVPLVLAESQSLSFERLVANKAKEAEQLHPLVPPLLPSSKPLVAIQVTVFPGSGLSLGFTVKHVLADGSACTHFLKSLAAIFKAGGDVSVAKDLPITDRTALLRGLEPLKVQHLEEAAAASKKKLGSRASLSESRGAEEARVVPDRVTRSTFVLTRGHIQKLRKKIASTGPYKEVAPPMMSTFTNTCAYLWVCQTKSRDDMTKNNNTVYFGFPADCRPRFVPPIPASYFGNCVTMAAVVEASRAELTGENGLAAASEAIQRAIRRLEKGLLLNEALSTRRRWREVKKNSEPGAPPLCIDGSPRLRLYDTDFGWGRPRKVESISIESFEAVSMTECRDEEGGVEIGIVGPEDEMLRFGSYFEEDFKYLIATILSIYGTFNYRPVWPLVLVPSTTELRLVNFGRRFVGNSPGSVRYPHFLVFPAGLRPRFAETGVSSVHFAVLVFNFDFSRVSKCCKLDDIYHE